MINGTCALGSAGLHDFFLLNADESGGRHEEEKNPVNEVDLLMEIAESLPGVSTRFGSLRIQ